MGNFRKRALAAGAAVALTAALAACGGGSDDGDEGSSGGGEATKGGTLVYKYQDPIEHWDPQRSYVGRDMSNMTRMVYRQLVAFPISEDPEVANTPVPDLATDTGTSTQGGKTWSFTLKDGVTWQDGSDITCEDVKYGASRVFATSVITGGPNYLINYLDIPTDPKTGESMYKGPYTKQGQEYFDKAVTCDGKTITYHFNKPWPDFPLAIASLHMMDPYKQSEDDGDKSNFKVFSSGPYMLDGEWNKQTGGTFVRNPEYDAATDDPENIRRALPDTIEFKIGETIEVQYDQFLADSPEGQNAITGSRVPTAYYPQVFDSGDPAVEERTYSVESPYVDYLIPNMKSPVFQKLEVRQALLAATDVEGYIKAGGGERARIAADSIVNPAVEGYQPNPAFEDMGSGDPEAAKALLAKAGVQTPVAFTFTYQDTETFNKQAAVLKEKWDAAGFKVTLNPLGDTYYDVIQKPTTEAQLYWGGWGADWPSAITVTPPLFQKNQLNEATNGQNYGAFVNDDFEAAAAEAQSASNLDDQTAALQEADKILGEQVAYIPLTVEIFNFMHGSKIAGYGSTPASNGYPDLGMIGVNE